MSKIATGIIMGLLAAVAAGCWGIFAIEKGRQDLELRQLEAQRQAALESEAHAASHHASRWQSLWGPLLNAAANPKAPDGLSARSVGVKSYRRSDVKVNGKSKKYGNARYAVSFAMGFHDRATKGPTEALLRTGNSKLLEAALRGVWKHMSVRCVAERLDGGGWVASDYTFTPLSTPPDFPFEKIKGDD